MTQHRLAIDLPQLFSVALITLIVGHIASSVFLRLVEIFERSTGQLLDFFLDVLIYWVRMLGG